MKKLTIIILVLFLFSACSKKPAIEETATVNMAGEWWVEYYVDGSAITDYSKILTYNTADPASGQVWVEDGDVGEFKSKFDVDYANLAFKAMPAAVDVANAGNTIKVYEGKVIPKAGHSKTGNPVDSIYLKVEFSNDPGTIYQISGHQRTGFFEDEY